MRLAEACGRVDVDAMLSEITPQQFCEWVAKDQVEPIGMTGVHSILAKLGELLGRGSMSQAHFMPWAEDDHKAEEQLSPAASRSAITSHLRSQTGGA